MEPVRDEQSGFSRLLRQSREAAGLSRSELAQRVGLDDSYVYRLETGDRRPSRQTVLLLAEALEQTDNEAVDEWLAAAGHAPTPTMAAVRGAMRVRARGASPSALAAPSSDWDAAQWTSWLERQGLQDGIGRILKAMKTRGHAHAAQAARLVAAAFSRTADVLEAPVQKAIIPAAGGEHRILSPASMQSLLLRAIREATEGGVADIALVLAPGSEDDLYTPLKEALDVSVVPPVRLHCYKQPEPEGLGDAILRAEELVGKEPFAVLLPDDPIRKRTGRAAPQGHLGRMLRAFRRLDDAHLVAVMSVTKSKMPRCGVVEIGAQQIAPGILPIVRLVEKPRPADPICKAKGALGIAGRYLLQASVFAALHEIKQQKRQQEDYRVELTDALELLRHAGEKVHAFEIKGVREDIGEVLGEAERLVRPPS